MQETTVEDALNALNILILSPDKLIMPSAQDVMGVIRSIENERAGYERRIEEDRRRRLESEEPEFASPERVAEFLKELSGTLSEIVAKRDINRRAENYFIPDESYDWNGCFSKLDEAQSVKLTDDTIPTVPSKEAA